MTNKEMKTCATMLHETTTPIPQAEIEAMFDDYANAQVIKELENFMGAVFESGLLTDDLFGVVQHMNEKRIKELNSLNR